MGNLCMKASNQSINNTTAIEEDGRLKKLFSPKEIEFWTEIRDLGFTKISEIKSKSVFFNFSDLLYENFLSLSAIMNDLIQNENFFLFNNLFETLLAIIDFTQIIFHLKKKLGLEKFFLINFNKFSLMREPQQNANFFCKLVYLDHKLADYYNSPEIVVREDTNLLSSFSFATSSQAIKSLISGSNRSSNSKATISANNKTSLNNNNLNLNENFILNKTGNNIGTNLNSLYDTNLTNINYNNNNNNDKYNISNNYNNNNNNAFENANNNSILGDAAEDLFNKGCDLNSFFYSRCNERYKKLRENYSLESCEFFYAECFINFLMKFLTKKTLICDSMLSHDFRNFRTKLKSTLTFILKTYKNKISLQKLKEILANFYLNNYEYNSFKDKCEKILCSRETQNAALFDKIVLHENISVQLIYGECDILSGLSKHAVSFVFDAFFKNGENSILRINCNKAILNLDSQGKIKSVHNSTRSLNGIFNNNNDINYNKNNDFKEEKKSFENLEEDIHGEYDWENRSNSFKNRRSLIAKGNAAGGSYSSNYIMKESNNNHFNESDSLNKSINNNNNVNRKNTYVRNKAELSDKSIICLNCSKKIFLNNLPSEVSSMVNLNSYYKDCLEKKYPNFALEKVLNYFCYFFSIEVYFDIEKKMLRNNSSFVNISTFNVNNSTFIDNKGAVEAFDFNNLLFFKEKNHFFVYKRNEYSIVFVYQGDSNKNYVVINLDEYSSLAETKNRISNI